MFTLQDNYRIKLMFGQTEIPITPQHIDELTIVQDMEKFLPSFRLRIKDSDGVLTHVAPFDISLSKISISILEDSVDNKNSNFDFTIFRRFPESDATLQSSLDIVGLLDMQGMFSPDYCRSWNKSIGTVLRDIAVDELKCNKVEISPSLNTAQILVQPRWSNIQFLKYHKGNLLGRTDEHNFKCFIKVEGNSKTFVFKSIDELIKERPTYTFQASGEVKDDIYPMFSYKIIDNYRIFESFGGKTQSYSYFDYTNSEFVHKEEQASNYLSLADYFLFDGSDSSNSNEMTDTGRSSEFTKDFAGRIKTKYSHRLNSAVKMWVSTVGLKGLVPGMVVLLVFPQSTDYGGVRMHQYSGFWLVERVSHSIGSMFATAMLLTRNGLDTEKNTTLVKATRKKTV